MAKLIDQPGVADLVAARVTKASETTQKDLMRAAKAAASAHLEEAKGANSPKTTLAAIKAATAAVIAAIKPAPTAEA